MRVAECIRCHCTIDNGEFLYLVGWGDWRKNDPSWISRQDFIRQIKGEYIQLLIDFDADVNHFTSSAIENID